MSERIVFLESELEAQKASTMTQKLLFEQTKKEEHSINIDDS